MTTSDRAAWTVKDEDIHHELSALMNLSEAEREALAALHGAAEAAAPAMAESFYDRLLAHEATAEYFSEGEMDARHQTIAAWFADLFAGTYDASYVRDRLRIGFVHVKIGLPVRYPLAMLDVVMRYGSDVTDGAADAARARAALQKVLALDVAIFNQAYEDNQLKHLAELVGGERLARRLLMGQA